MHTRLTPVPFARHILTQFSNYIGKLIPCREFADWSINTSLIDCIERSFKIHKQRVEWTLEPIGMTVL